MRVREYKLAARTIKKNVFHFAEMHFAVLQYIFAMYFAFNWKQAWYTQLIQKIICYA
jgi:hypothetical protein